MGELDNEVDKIKALIWLLIQREKRKAKQKKEAIQ